jgi:hypothetical protein
LYASRFWLSLSAILVGVSFSVRVVLLLSADF